MWLRWNVTFAESKISCFNYNQGTSEMELWHLKLRYNLLDNNTCVFAGLTNVRVFSYMTFKDFSSCLLINFLCSLQVRKPIQFEISLVMIDILVCTKILNILLIYQVLGFWFLFFVMCVLLLAQFKQKWISFGIK